MVTCARSLQEAARADDFEQVAVLAGQMETEAARLQQDIRAYLSQL